MHKKTAARKKSRLAKKLNALKAKQRRLTWTPCGVSTALLFPAVRHDGNDANHSTRST